MERRKSYCNSCGHDTWHQISSHVEQMREDTLFGVEQNWEAEVLQCCGCDLFSFRLVTHPFSFQDEGDKPDISFYPEREHNKRKRKYFARMPSSVRTLYHETVTAHDAKLVLLSAVGLRALLEAIIIDRVDSTKFEHSLESKINALADVLEPKVLQTLHDFRMVGNQAVHAQIEPDHLDIHRALYVVESLMEYFYGLADGAETYQELKSKPKAKHKVKNGA